MRSSKELKAFVLTRTGKPQGKKNNLTRQSLQLGSHTVASCRQNTDHMFSDFHKISLHMDHQKKAAVPQSNFLKSHSLGLEEIEMADLQKRQHDISCIA